jgi:hypothetical protein
MTKLTKLTHHHHPHIYERLEQAESWIGGIAAPLALLLGAIMAVGLLSATGHVTW